MSILLSKISKEKKTCYLAGDFNMNLLQWENNSDIEHYFDVITGYNFTPLITSPTRITSKTKTLIDNILFNEYTSNIVSGNLTVGISDHMPQFALIPDFSKNKKSSIISTKQFIRKYNKIDTSIFSQDLDRINWGTSKEDANQYGNNFFHIFKRMLDIYAPLKEVRHSKKADKKYAKPWITKEILKLIKIKDKTYKDLVKEKDATKKEEFSIKYRQQKNQITKLIRTSKKRSIFFKRY